MTVVAIRERPYGNVEIECVWFETQAMGGEAKALGYFPPAALDSIDE